MIDLANDEFEKRMTFSMLFSPIVHVLYVHIHYIVFIVLTKVQILSFYTVGKQLVFCNTTYFIFLLISIVLLVYRKQLKNCKFL